MPDTDYLYTIQGTQLETGQRYEIPKGSRRMRLEDCTYPGHSRGTFDTVGDDIVIPRRSKACEVHPFSEETFFIVFFDANNKVSGVRDVTDVDW